MAGYGRFLTQNLPWYRELSVSARKIFTYDSILILRIGVPTPVFDLCHLLIQFYHPTVHRNTAAYGGFTQWHMMGF